MFIENKKSWKFLAKKSNWKIFLVKINKEWITEKILKTLTNKESDFIFKSKNSLFNLSLSLQIVKYVPLEIYLNL